MAEHKKKPKWGKPKLMVLLRAAPEETILGTCKSGGGGPSTDGGGCHAGGGFCAPCSSSGS